MEEPYYSGPEAKAEHEATMQKALLQSEDKKKALGRCAGIFTAAVERGYRPDITIEDEEYIQDVLLRSGLSGLALRQLYSDLKDSVTNNYTPRSLIPSYRSGEMRNKPCVCGSGTKFKKCCWNKYADKPLPSKPRLP